MIKWFLLALAWVAAAAAAAQEPPLAVLHEVQTEVGSLMWVHKIARDAEPDPQALWDDLPSAEPRAGTISTDAFASTVGRLRLALPAGGPALYTLQVPSTRLDRVRLWYRVQGEPWRGAEAGDRVPLSRWPFYGQFPAFSLPLGPAPLDVMVTLDNAGPVPAPLLVTPQKVFSEGRLRQANLSGVITGMGLMVAVVCLLVALTQPAYPSWVLFGFAFWSVLTVISVNGYGAIWFYPESPQLNDGAKLLTGMVLAAWMLWSTIELLDRPYAWLRAAGPAAACVALVASVLLMTVLPPWWRLPLAVLFSVVCLLAAAALCVLNGWAGGRSVRPVGAAVALYGAVVGLGAAGPVVVDGLDLTSAGAASLLFGCALLLMYAYFNRVRYGRDVLGRAAISAYRDPLTALWSYEGFQQQHAQMALRQAAGQPAPAMMLLQLPGLEQSALEHGFEMTERALVRFAAVLQSTMGEEWEIGRLSKTRFAVLSLHPMNGEAMIRSATELLSRCARVVRPLGPVADFDLRIVCRHRVAGSQGLSDLVREMDDAGRQMERGRRIALS